MSTKYKKPKEAKASFPCLSMDGTKVDVWSGLLDDDPYLGIAVDFKGFFGDHYSYAWLTVKEAKALRKQLKREIKGMEAFKKTKELLTDD